MYSFPRLIALMVCTTFVIVTASLPTFSHAAVPGGRRTRRTRMFT